MARQTKPASEARPEDEPASTGAATDLFDVPEGERGVMPDLLRRLMTAGFTGLFTTESAIRGALGDTVPREWLEFVTAQGDRTRDEFLAKLAQEFVAVLESVDVVELAEQMLAGRTIEVKAEFKLGPRTNTAESEDASVSTVSKPSSKPSSKHGSKPSSKPSPSASSKSSS